MLIDLICFTFYFLAAGIIVAGMFQQQNIKNTASLVCILAALALHILTLKTSIFIEPTVGQNMSMLNVASLVGWLICVTMVLASFKLPNTILLPVVYGFTGLLVLLNSFIPSDHVMQINVQPTLLVHIGLALFAYACLAIASLYALQLAYINFRLKEKNVALLHSSLPPMMTVEKILFKLLTVGFFLLTLSLMTGFMFLQDMFANEQAHKTVLSLLAWSIYLVILAGHWSKGWRGKAVTWLTVSGGVLLTLAYFGSRFVREVLLNA